MPNLYFFIFGIICILIGLICIFIRIKVIVSCREKVDATITSVNIDKIILRGSTIRTYCPNFSYVIDDKTYEGTASFNTTDKEKYKVGDRFPIHVNKANPAEYNFKGRYGVIIFGVIVFGIGSLFAILYFM